ncbi:MAG: CbiQ family ECF transporter T component [Methylotenera sp.]
MLSFIMMLLGMSFLSNQWIGVLCMIACAAAIKLASKSFLRVVRRMRWLFISILLVYAFATPGEYISNFPVSFAPTYEGLQFGLLQIAKLLIALASLSILLTSSTNAQLMAGLYCLLSPLKLLGLNVGRFTARLLLTLDYVEELALEKTFKLQFNQLDAIHLTTENVTIDKIVVLQQFPFTIADKLVLCTLAFGALAMLALGVSA